MRPILAILTAAALATGAAACGSGDDLQDSLDAVGETVGEVASDVGDTVEEAASEVGRAAEDAADLVGFCTAAYRTQDAVEDRDPAEALEAAEDLLERAPEEIRPQVETVRDGARAYQGGDEEAIEDEEFQQALSELGAYLEDRCDPRS